MPIPALVDACQLPASRLTEHWWSVGPRRGGPRSPRDAAVARGPSLPAQALLPNLRNVALDLHYSPFLLPTGGSRPSIPSRHSSPSRRGAEGGRSAPRQRPPQNRAAVACCEGREQPSGVRQVPLTGCRVPPGWPSVGWRWPRGREEAAWRVSEAAPVRRASASSPAQPASRLSPCQTSTSPARPSRRGPTSHPRSGPNRRRCGRWRRCWS